MLNDLKAVILDMDGVLWRGSEPLPGMTDFIAFLRQRDIPFALATNNSSRLPAQYVEKLAGMGVPDMRPEQIVTSGTATVDYLQRTYAPGTRIHVFGMEGLRHLVREGGFVLVDEAPQAVVVGIDFDLHYAAARKAALLIRAGADFIGTNPDRTFPTPDGLVPGTGSLLALLEAATDVTPTIIGKPEPAMFRAALRTLGSDAARTLMIGDRLGTDIAGGKGAGLRTALVLTGVTTRDEAATSPIQPDAMFEDLPHLLRAWSGG